MADPPQGYSVRNTEDFQAALEVLLPFHKDVSDAIRFCVSVVSDAYADALGAGITPTGRLCDVVAEVLVGASDKQLQ